MVNKLLSSFVVKLINAVGLFVLLILTSRYFGTEGRGELSLFVVNMTLIQLINEIVIGPAMVYFVPRFRLSTLMLISFLWSILSTSFGVTILYFSGLSKEVFLPELFAVVLIASLYSSFMMVLQGEKRFLFYNILFLTQTILLVSLFCLKIFLQKEVTIFDYLFCFKLSYLLPGSIVLGYLLTRIRGMGLENSWEDAKRILSMGLVAQISNMLNFANNRISYYLIALAFLDEASLGIYSISVALSESVLLVSYSIAFIQYPMISNSADSGDNFLLTLKFVKLCFWVTLLSVLLLIVLPNWFYIQLFGKEFIDLASIVIILAPGILLTSISKIYWNFFNGVGDFKLINYTILLVMLVSIVLNIFLISHYGIHGAAVSASLSALLQCLLFMIAFKKRSGFSFASLLPNFLDFQLIKKI